MVKRKQTEHSNGSRDSAPAPHRAKADGVLEDVVEEAEEPQALPAPDLDAELQEAREEAASHLDDLLRARAELENLRKRSVRDVENARKFGLERFMTELLSAKDSVELGLNA
ncbi:MAG: nucleotide exchange factor GrpE, partial [Lysobacterales bacterium]